jgi:hypothetical protein
MLPIILSLEESSSFIYVFYTSRLILIEEAILVFYIPLHFYKCSIQYEKSALKGVCSFWPAVEAKLYLVESGTKNTDVTGSCSCP